MHILFCPVRIGLSFCYTYKETSEGYESNKILSDMIVPNKVKGCWGAYFVYSGKDRVKIFFFLQGDFRSH